MFASPDESADDFLSQLRSRSPAALLASSLVGLVMLALAINLLSSAIYDSLTLLFIPAAEAPSTSQLWLDLVLAAAAVALLAFCVAYLRRLSDQLAPQVQRVITLVLPFARKQEHIEFNPIESLAAHSGLDQLLNWPIARGEAQRTGLEWDSQWTWPNGRCAKRCFSRYGPTISGSTASPYRRHSPTEADALRLALDRQFAGVSALAARVAGADGAAHGHGPVYRVRIPAHDRRHLRCGGNSKDSKPHNGGA